MSAQKFNAAAREAIWLAYNKKCAYTSELLDVANFHIDHILPEWLLKKPAELARVKVELGLPDSFDILDWGNLLPCRPGANLKKSSLVFDLAHLHFFLAIADGKKMAVQTQLSKIEKRNNKGKAAILLLQYLENGQLLMEDVTEILTKYAEQPDQIFKLLENLQFADQVEISAIAKSDIETLCDRPIRMGNNDHIDGVTLTNDNNEMRHLRTCRQYDEAIKEGFFAYSTFDIKMSTYFEQQCGLLRLMRLASTPIQSNISNPKVGIVDIELLPFSMFPQFGEPTSCTNSNETYQSKVKDGTLVIKRIRQNLLQIEELDGMGQHLVEVARADFNGDGIEDILLFEYCYATHGTLGFGGIRVITRNSLDGLFTTVDLTPPS